MLAKLIKKPVAFYSPLVKEGFAVSRPKHNLNTIIDVLTFLPKLWMPLATVFVEIFQKGKNSEVLDQGVLKFFEQAVCPPLRCP